MHSFIFSVEDVQLYMAATECSKREQCKHTNNLIMSLIYPAKVNTTNNNDHNIEYH